MLNRKKSQLSRPQGKRSILAVPLAQFLLHSRELTPAWVDELLLDVSFTISTI